MADIIQRKGGSINDPGHKLDDPKHTNFLRTEDILKNGMLIKKVMREGVGPLPATNGSVIVEVNYTGKLQDGTVFDSTSSRGKSFKFTLGAGQVILGWEKGVATMKTGELAILEVPPEYAYGDNGRGPIPPNSKLEFELELLGWRTVGQQRFMSLLKFLLFLGLVYILLVQLGYINRVI